MPFRVHTHRGNISLEYWGVDARGTALTYYRPVGPADERPGCFHDALGVAVLQLIRLFEKVQKERDEYLELLSAEPSERAKKKRQAQNGKET